MRVENSVLARIHGRRPIASEAALRRLRAAFENFAKPPLATRLIAENHSVVEIKNTFGEGFCSVRRVSCIKNRNQTIPMKI